jgi:hypothetical protein
MRAMVLAAMIWGLAAAGAVAGPKEMQSVIDRQLQLFSADDFAGAMEFASPVLKRYFATPENFRRMVTQGYPMVWRFDSVEFLENRVENGENWQRVRIRDQQGVVHVLDYRMIETPEGWRINGVLILSSTDLTA